MNYANAIGPSLPYAPGNLPVCPAPDDTTQAPLLPLADPAAVHCYVAPSIGGLTIGGVPVQSTALFTFNPETPLPSTTHPLAESAPLNSSEANNSTPAAALQPGCFTSNAGYQVCQNGIQTDFFGATAVADWAVFNYPFLLPVPAMGSVNISNWSAVQNSADGDFWQVGFDFNNTSWYSSSCTSTDYPAGVYAPVLFSEVEYNGSYWNPGCWKNYTLSSGQATGFETDYTGSNYTWDQWVQYDGNWELLNAFGPISGMVPSNSTLEIIQETQWTGSEDPYMDPIADGSNQILQGSSWKLWNDLETTTYVAGNTSCMWWTPTSSPGAISYGNFGTLNFYYNSNVCP